MLHFVIFGSIIIQCLALYSSPHVVTLTPFNFDQLVVNSDEIWIVEFFAPWCGHCQQLVPEYEKTAEALKGIIKVGAVNVDENKELGGKYGVTGFPTIKIFANKKKPEAYDGARTAQGLAERALEAARSRTYAQLGTKSYQQSGSNSNNVIELTDSNFDELVLDSDDMWLVEFFAPWCGHCRNLAPHWAVAASKLKGKIKLGALDATVYKQKASQFGIQSFPTIKYFGPGKKAANSAVNYDGGRTANDIVNWALQRVFENVPSPDIIEIVDKATFKETCEDKVLCVISVLPNILDCQSKCRNDYLSLLKGMGDKYKRRLWGWIWTEAGSQFELENALDMGGFGYPAMAVLNAKKLKYSVFRGSFSEVGINEFLRDLSYGKGNSVAIRGGILPEIVNVAPWDGKDGVLPPEEEIDLSDVVLDEKDEL